MDKTAVLFKLLLILVITIAVHSLTAEELKKRDKISNECRVKTGTTPEEVYGMRRGRFSNTPEAIQHYLCFHKKMRLVHDNNEFDLEAVRHKIRKFTDDEMDVDQIMARCNVRKKYPSEEDTYFGLQCLVKEVLRLARIEQFRAE